MSVLRRIVDILVAAFALVLLSPMFAVVAVAIAVGSPGNPFYGGWRVGKDGVLFRMWKFRTMVKNADRIGPPITGRRDSRLTRLGRFLRKTKIDEFPQFINLLTGNLTLVGPRPEAPEIVARYTPPQRAVLEVTPGIVGPGQLYYTTDQEDSIPEGVSPDDYYVEHLLGPKLEMDLEYLRRRGVGTDLRLVLDTMRVMIGGLIGVRRG